MSSTRNQLPTPGPLLTGISGPADLRRLSPAELTALAAELRAYLTGVVSRNGGHLASNLGVIELTIALHRAYDFTRDRLVFDVGHQCYPHKLLTGRLERFGALRQLGGLSGFPQPAESVCDPFVVGHASTSISSALGLATAYRLRGEDRRVVALVGDGAIGGGLCFEALNHAGHVKEDLLVVLNDNDMAIAETVGAFAAYLTDIRARPLTQTLRQDIQKALRRIPLLGAPLDWLQEQVLEGIKGLIDASHIFSAMGFRYFGPLDGHDLGLLERELSQLRQTPGPKLLHVVTRKGEGFSAAQADPEKYHSAAPFEIKLNGEVVNRSPAERTYTEIFADALVELGEQDSRVVAITAAMPAGAGSKRFAARFPDRCMDVGIAEAHGVTFAAGLARAGLKPVVAIYSTFLQRAYDQIMHDVALQPGLNVVFALDRAGLVGEDGPTHHGAFDIAYLRHLPGLTLLAPRDGEELRRMLAFALTLEGPAAIRYPRGVAADLCALPRAPLAWGRAELLRAGNDGTVFAYGRMVAPALAAAEKLAAADGAQLAVYNARFAKPLDEAALDEALARSPLVVTVEDHALAGGFGSAVGEVLARQERLYRLVNLGLPDRFIELGSPAQLDARLGLDPAGLQAAFQRALRSDHACVGRIQPTS